MRNVEKLISPLVETQFPSFFKEEGPNFVAFVRAYYEWMEQDQQLLDYSRNLMEYRDIDRTINDFVSHFSRKYLANIPAGIAADNRLVIKHIQDLYRTKGTEQGVELLFRLLFDVSADVYYPGQDVFKVSSGEWVVPQYIEVSPSPINDTLIKKTIQGTTTKATAFVERIVRKRIKGKFIDVLYISAIQGEFAYNERVVNKENPIIEGAPKIIGSLTDLVVTNGGQDFAKGDVLTITGGSGQQGKALVTDISTETGRVSFKIEDGGFGYSTNAHVIVSQRNLTYDNISNANSSITTFERFETVVQPQYTIEYSSTANSSSFANGSIVENYHANGTVSANAVVVYNEPVNANSGTMIVVPHTGNLGSDSTISLKGNTATAVMDSYTNTTATGNVMHITNTSIGVFDITNVFNAYEGNYIYGLSSNTYANVTVRSAGVGARFAVGKLTNEETVFVYSDLLRANNTGNVAFMSILLDGSNSNVAANGYGFVKYPQGTINTPLQHILRFGTKTIGEISVLSGINPGEGYNVDPFVYVIEPEIASLEKRDTTLKITTPFGLFIKDELVEMSSNSTGQQVSVTGFSGTAANGSSMSTAELGEYVWQSNGTANVATGYVNQVNLSGGAGTIRISNTTGTFVNTYSINTLTTNATATVSLANTVTITTLATGKVKESNTSVVKVRRLNLFSDFAAGYTLLGKVSGAVATITDASDDETFPVMGENATVSANVQVANTVVSTLQVVDSGFGYVDSETVTLTSNTGTYEVTAKASLKQHGRSEGYYKTERGFLDGSSRVFDGDYYQDYSYEVQSRLPLNKYADVLKNIMHTAGTQFFGKVILDSVTDSADQFNSTVPRIPRTVALNISGGSGTFVVGESISSTNVASTYDGASGVYVINSVVSPVQYIEPGTLVASPSFSANTNNATVGGVTTNATHTTVYVTPSKGTIDSGDTIEVVVGRTLGISNVHQGNTVTGSFAVGEIVYQSNTVGGVTANGIVTAANSTFITINGIDGVWVANGEAYGVTSNAYANVATIVNATSTYTLQSAINTLHASNVSGKYVTSSTLTGANSSATATIDYISINIDT